MADEASPERPQNVSRPRRDRHAFAWAKARDDTAWSLRGGTMADEAIPERPEKRSESGVTPWRSVRSYVHGRADLLRLHPRKRTPDGALHRRHRRSQTARLAAQGKARPQLHRPQ